MTTVASSSSFRSTGSIRAEERIAHGAGRVAWLDGLDLELAEVDTHRRCSPR